MKYLVLCNSTDDDKRSNIDRGKKYQSPKHFFVCYQIKYFNFIFFSLQKWMPSWNIRLYVIAQMTIKEVMLIGIEVLVTKNIFLHATKLNILMLFILDYRNGGH